MKLLVTIFTGMFLYGVAAGPLGAGILSLGMAVFTFWAGRKFAAQDRAWVADPRNAPKPRSTQEMLDEAGVECSASKSPA